MVEASETKPKDEQTDSIEEEKKSAPANEKKQKKKETYLSEQEAEKIAKGKQIFEGDPENALQENQAKKGSNSVSVN